MAACSSQRVLITLVIVLSVLSVILIGVMILRETREEEKLKLTGVNLLKEYSSIFRTNEQQRVYLQNYRRGIENRYVISDKVPARNGTCQFSCLSREPARRRRQVAFGGVYHGCCVSSVQFSAPRTKLNVFGVNRTLVQLTDVSQFFAVHLCQSVSGCTGCICSQENNLHTAVVYKTSVSEAEYIEDTDIDFFFFPGCCKCVNT